MFSVKDAQSLYFILQQKLTLNMKKTKKHKGFISDTICRFNLKTYCILDVFDASNLSIYFLTVYFTGGNIQCEVGLKFQ